MPIVKGDKLPPMAIGLLPDAGYIGQPESEHSVGEELDAVLESQSALYSTAFSERSFGDALRATISPNAFTQDDPNFNPLDYLAGYEEYEDEIARARDINDLVALKSDIDRQRKAKSIASNASFPVQMLGGITAGIIDFAPILTLTPLLPTGALANLVRGRGVLNSTLSGAAAASAEIGASEAILQVTDPTRTNMESWGNIGGAALIGGVLGGGIKGADILGDLYTRGAIKTKTMDELARKLEQDLSLKDVTPDTEINVPDLTRVAKGVGADAMLAAADIRRPKIFGVDIGKFAFGWMTPSMRAQFSGVTEYLDLYSKLGSTYGVREGAERGVAVDIPIELKVGLRLDDLAVFVENEVAKRHKDLLKSREKVTIRDYVNSYDDFSKAVGVEVRRMANGVESPNVAPQVLDAARSVKKYIDNFKKELEAAGLPVREGYGLQAVLNRDSVAADPKGFRKLVTEKYLSDRTNARARLNDYQEYLKTNPEKAIDYAEFHKGKDYDWDSYLSTLDDAELGSHAYEFTDRVLSGSYNPSRSAVGTPNNARFKQRDFFIDGTDVRFEKYMENNVNQLLYSYTKRVGADLEITKTFGSWDNYLAEKEAIFGEGGALAKFRDKLTNPKKVKKFSENVQKYKDDFQFLEDRLRGTYDYNKGWSPEVVAWLDVVRKWNFLRLMGNMVPSSLAELGMATLNHGFSKSFKYFIAPMAKRLARMDVKMTKERASAYTAAAEVQINRMHMYMMGADEVMPVRNSILKGMNKAAFGFSHLNLNYMFTNAVREIAANAEETILVKTLLKNRLTKDDWTMLSERGIGKKNINLFKGQVKKHAVDQENMGFANLNKWDDLKTAQDFRYAVRRGIELTNFKPSIGGAPRFTASPWGQVISQFKGFTFSATERILLRSMQRADAATFQGMAFMFTLGMLSYYLTQQFIKGGEKKEINTADLIYNGIDKSGILAILADVSNITQLPMLFGVKSPGTGTTFAERIAGPSASLASNLGTSIFALADADLNSSEVRAMRSIMFGQNLFWLRRIADDLQQSAIEEISE